MFFDFLRYLSNVCNQQNRLPGAWSLSVIRLIVQELVHTHQAQDDAEALAVAMKAILRFHLRQAYGV